MRRILRSRALKIAFAMVYSVIAAELYLRYVAPAPIMPRYVVATSYGVRANQPNVTYYHTTPECYVRMEINSNGIRSNREIPYKKRPGLKRIIVLGDSYGMGYEVDLDEMFVTQMQRRLEEAGVDCEVVNLSVSGHGNAEELITLRAEGFKYEPDLVLVCWHSTDFDENLRSALYKLEGGKLVRDRTSYLPGTGLQQQIASYAAYRWISENCQLYGFLREVAGGKVKILLDRLKAARKKKDDAVTSPKKEQTPADPGKQAPESPQNDGKSRPLTDPERLSIALLHEIQSEARNHGANTLVLDIPDVAWKHVDISSRFPPDPEGKDFGLRVVSPVERFHKAPSDELIYRRRGQNHLTPLGCRIVGELLSETILKEHLLGEAGPRHDHPGFGASLRDYVHRRSDWSRVRS